MAYARECLLCKTRYEYCPRCDKFRNEPKWKTMFHDENCNKIFNTLQLHSTHKITDEEAISRLESCDLSVLKKATETIQNQVADILAKKVAPAEEPVEGKEEPIPIQTKRVSSKRKTNNEN